MGHLWPRHIIVRYHHQITELNATTLIWAFFQNYPLPSAGVPQLTEPTT
jgi:poly(3-hydroxybutyrate) depolymerase